MKKELSRCGWTKDDVLMNVYHDEEWGVPVHDDKKWFEFIVLDAFQAGLSWRTVLYKRENFRKSFANYDLNKIIKFDAAKVEDLMQDAGIIRNRLKINATIKNAIAFKQVQKEFGSFDSYIWKFTNNKSLINKWKSLSDIPASTPLSDVISKDMKKRGFAFCGSTIVYAFMQAAGMVNDHITKCYRHNEISQLRISN